jgi:hypothetical protein
LPEPAQRPPSRAALIGRRIASAIYWIVAIYVIGAGFASVIPQVFWPAHAHGIAPEARVDCAAGMLDLRTDLLRDAADRTRHLGAEPRGPFLEGWDERYRALEAPCGDLPSYSLLARLRYGVEEHLLRFETEQAPLAADTLRAIEAGDGSSHHRALEP